MPGTLLLIAAGAVAVAGVGWPLATWWEVSKLEKPQYEVLKVVNTRRRGLFDSAPSVEIRRYAPYLVAKVVIENPNMKEAMGQGFKKVAGFIFGGNTKPGSDQSEKIAMTTPVQSEKTSGSGRPGNEKISMTSPVTTEMADGRYVVAFVMPSKYTKESLPKPNDEDVKIEEVPAQLYAALSWRGGKRPTDEVVAKKRQELLAELDRAGITADQSANTRLFQYYPPFAPQAIRLADILLPVDETSVRTSGPSSSSSRDKRL